MDFKNAYADIPVDGIPSLTATLINGGEIPVQMIYKKGMLNFGDTTRIIKRDYRIPDDKGEGGPATEIITRDGLPMVFANELRIVTKQDSIDFYEGSRCLITVGRITYQDLHTEDKYYFYFAIAVGPKGYTTMYRATQKVVD